MADELRYGQILEAAGELSEDEQETLVEVLKKRLRERRRTELAKDIKAAREEFARGGCPSVTPAELMKEILS